MSIPGSVEITALHCRKVLCKIMTGMRRSLVVVAARLPRRTAVATRAVAEAAGKEAAAATAAAEAAAEVAKAAERAAAEEAEKATAEEAGVDKALTPTATREVGAAALGPVTSKSALQCMRVRCQGAERAARHPRVLARECLVRYMELVRPAVPL